MTKRLTILRWCAATAAGPLVAAGVLRAEPAIPAGRDTGVPPVPAARDTDSSGNPLTNRSDVARTGGTPVSQSASQSASRSAPLWLTQDPYESIYLPPGPPREEEGVNAGGVNGDLKISYLTDYVYRGVDQSERLAHINDLGVFDPNANVGAEDAPNLQFDGSLKLNLGKLPHPIAGVFANVFNDDPVSRFQEIRPYFGIDWDLKPLRITAGQISYIYPERETLNTNEIWTSITFDDSRLWHTEKPLLSPYVYVAYDYDLYDGLYVETGIRHAFEIEDTGITLTAVADVAYVLNNAQFTDFTSSDPQDTGFQHYDVGLIGTLSLNHVIGIPRRYGEWTVDGMMFYTDNINKGLRADTQVWGGVVIGLKY